MGYSADVIAGTLQDLQPGFEYLYTLDHPFLDRLHKGGRIGNYKLKGRELLFDVLTGGPGQGLTDRFGGAIVSGARRQNLQQGNEQPARLVYYFDVPHKDEDDSDGVLAMAGIVKKYGEAALYDVREMCARQYMAGSSSASTDPVGGFDGLVTFNGTQTYDPQGTARTGVFEANAPASQTATVFGLAKQGAASGVTGWYHQYAHISSFRSHGRKTLRSQRDKANQQGASFSGGMDLGLCDDGTYQNYAESLDNQVTATVVENDKGQGKIREGLKLGDAAVFSEPSIDLTDTAFSGVWLQGVFYGLTTGDWSLFFQGSKHNGPAAKHYFKVEPPIPLPDQLSDHFRLVTYQQLVCENLRRQVLVTGGNNP